jgi:ElaB/YqjD/DUF883 family membrane-anchored ribosome-binding protein
MKDNGGRRPEQILTDIHRTRDELEKTLVAIEHRLTPGQLVDQGVDYLRHSGANEFVHNLGGAAKQNPLPVALVGIGLAWLMALGRQPAQNYDSSVSTSNLRERASGALQSASETLSSTKERVSGNVTSMRERASDTVRGVRDRASQATDTAREQWERARGGLDYLVHEQPLALGAIGLALGAVLGAAAPRTRQEERLMGDASRGLAEKAREMGSQQLEKAQETVRQVAESASPGPERGPDSQPGQPEGNVPSQQAPDKMGSW